MGRLEGYQGRVYSTLLSKEAVAASTWYILVDISDTTNYSHPSGTVAVRILGLELETEKHGDGEFDVWAGVVRENDGTDGTADWIKIWHIEAVGNPTDSKDRFSGSADFTSSGSNPQGLDCSIVSSRLVYMRGPNSGNDVKLKNDDGSLVSSAGGSSLSSVAGDVVVWVEEIAGSTGTMDIALTCHYLA